MIRISRPDLTIRLALFAAMAGFTGGSVTVQAETSNPTSLAIAEDDETTGPVNPAVAASAALARQVTDCLAAVSQDCALRMALRVTAAGDLSIERARVLYAVADTLHELGDAQRARVTTTLAKEEAAAIGISVGTEQNYVRIAGLQGELGDAEAARATVAEIDDRYLKAHGLGHMAVGLTRAGQTDAAIAALRSVAEPVIGFNYALQVIEELAQHNRGLDQVDALEEVVAGLIDAESQSLLRFVADARLAAARAALGDTDGPSREMERLKDDLSYFTHVPDQARALVALARLQTALNGRGVANEMLERAIRYTFRIRVDYDRDRILRELVLAIAEQGDYSRAVEAMERFGSEQARSETLDLLAQRVGRTGDEQGLDVLRTVARNGLEGVAALESRLARDKIRVDYAMALTNIGAVEDAVQTIAAIENAEEQARALAYLARAL